jgi:hypothetical protein
MTQVERIKAEIERLQKCYKNDIQALEKECYTNNVCANWLKLNAQTKIDVCRQILSFINSLQAEPMSEDLEEAAKHYLYGNILYDDVYVGNPTDKDCIEMFKIGAEWQKEQFEKERLTHCDELTPEQAQTESDFVVKHLKENNRTPTFIDAIEYGKKLLKEQMMAKAVDGEVGYWNIRGLSISMELPSKLEEGDKVKLIIIKED